MLYGVDFVPPKEALPSEHGLAMTARGDKAAAECVPASGGDVPICLDIPARLIQNTFTT